MNILNGVVTSLVGEWLCMRKETQAAIRVHKQLSGSGGVAGGGGGGGKKPIPPAAS